MEKFLSQVFYCIMCTLVLRLINSSEHTQTHTHMHAHTKSVSFAPNHTLRKSCLLPTIRNEELLKQEGSLLTLFLCLHSIWRRQ